MNTAHDQKWRSIFSVLRQELEGEVAGRERKPLPEDLRKKLEQLAEGKLNEETVRKLCEEIAPSNEALQALALLLNKPVEDKTADETP